MITCIVAELISNQQSQKLYFLMFFVDSVILNSAATHIFNTISNFSLANTTETRLRRFYPLMIDYKKRPFVKMALRY